MIRKDIPCPSERFLLEFRKPRHQRGHVAGRDAVLRHLLAATGDSDVISQAKRLSSNETKIAPRSVRIAVLRSSSGDIWSVSPGLSGFATSVRPSNWPLSTPHGIFKPEHAVDLDTDVIVAAPIHPADEGDTTTLEPTLE
jgi:hypothetical protein